MMARCPSPTSWEGWRRWLVYMVFAREDREVAQVRSAGKGESGDEPDGSGQDDVRTVCIDDRGCREFGDALSSRLVM